MIGLTSHSSGAFAFDPPDPAELSAFIDQHELARSPGWLALGHYSKPWFGDVRGEADSANFYFSAAGKTDPKAELLATIAAMQEPRNRENPDAHPQCRMPARKRWIAENFAALGKLWMRQRCPELDWWVGELDVEQVTIVFAAHYLSNPASMFGHTFLRLDTKQVEGRPPLLDYGLNYGAVSNPAEGVLYYVKGLTGFYSGRFGLQPYYQKVQEYSNFESRDIWEYPLNLTAAEREMLVLHVWELQDIGFDYYFLDENCSYHILGIIDAAKPELALKEKYQFWTDPAATVRTLAAMPGVLSKPRYRPSITSKIRHRLEQMNEAERRAALALIRGEELTLPGSWTAERQALVLDAVMDANHFIAKDLGDDYSEEQRRKARRVASNRATLGPSANQGAVRRYSEPPETGHRMGFLGVNMLGGADGPGLGLRLHPAYHDLMADPTGYKEYSEILITDVHASLSLETSRWHFDQLRFFRSALYAPPQGVEDLWSFEAEVTMGRDLLAKDRQSRFGWVEVGLGLSRQLGPLVGSALAMSHAAAQPSARGHVALGPKVQILLPTPLGRWRLHATPWTVLHAGGQIRRVIVDQLDYRVSLTSSWDVWLSMRQREILTAGIGRYF